MFHWWQLVAVLETYPGQVVWLPTTRLINNEHDDAQHDKCPVLCVGPHMLPPTWFTLQIN